MSPLEVLLNKFKGGGREKTPVGLNIGGSAVKLARLRFTEGRAELSGYCVEPSQTNLEELVRRIARAHEIGSVNISVSGPLTMIRYIDFPKMSKAEMKQAVRFEAQKYIPFPMAEVSLDAAVLRDDLPGNKMKVLLAAVKKDFLGQKLKLLSDAGLCVNVVDIDSLALVNAFTYNYSGEEAPKNKTIALLNIGSATSNLNILENFLPALSRDISVAGNNFTQRIAEVFAVDSDSAEKLKTSADPGERAKVTAAVEPVVTKLAREMRTSFDYFESLGVSSVEKVFISGGGSIYPGLKQMLSSVIGIEVDCWDPLHKITLSPEIDPAKAAAVSCHLAVAVGLALRQ